MTISPPPMNDKQKTKEKRGEEKRRGVGTRTAMVRKLMMNNMRRPRRMMMRRPGRKMMGRPGRKMMGISRTNQIFL
jgi:hypothetical protein